MTMLDEAMSLTHATCLRINADRLRTAIYAHDWAQVRVLLRYISDDATLVEEIAARLAPGAVTATTEDAEVGAVEEVPSLAEWTYVIDGEV
jgi:hypothetical protein